MSSGQRRGSNGWTATSLVATPPGRFFCQGLYADYIATQQLRLETPGQYVDRTTWRTIVDLAHHAVTQYLYGPSITETRDNTAGFTDFCSYLARRLDEAAHNRLICPQIHHGNVTELRQPSILQPVTDRPTSIPRQAFWTADPIGSAEDSWTLYDEELLGSHRYELRFAQADVTAIVIDSADSWARLVRAFPHKVSGISYPHWAAIPEEYDAVYLTTRGLLTAHPPTLPADIEGVAQWSAVSTAWLRLPESAQLIRADAK